MTTDALSIISQAEYVAMASTGRSSHRVNSLLAQIYLLCAVEKLDEARVLIDILYKIISQDRILYHLAWISQTNHFNSLEISVRK